MLILSAFGVLDSSHQSTHFQILHACCHLFHVVLRYAKSKDDSTIRYGTLVRYAFFVKVRVRYVNTLFELKIPDFSHIAPAFCI